MPRYSPEHASTTGESDESPSCAKLLDTTPTIGADRAVIDAYAKFRAECRNAGHPLYDKQHNADRWNAASAIAKGLPLFAHDGIYTDAPGLTLFDAPGV